MSQPPCAILHFAAIMRRRGHGRERHRSQRRRDLGRGVGRIGRLHFHAIARLGLLHARWSGAGLLPVLVRRLMAALSLLLIWNALRNDSSQRDGVDWCSTGRALTTWLAFAVSVALMEPLGFLISFALLTFFIVAVIFRRPPVTAAVTAVVAALAFHLTFPVLLNVPLPVGLLGF